MDLSPKVASVYKEVADYQDLLLLGDLPTISQEKRPYSWISTAPSLSSEAQTALTTSLMGLTLKLTGAKVPGNFKFKLPGGKMRSKSKTEVLAYLALIQVRSTVKQTLSSLPTLSALWTPWPAARTGRRRPRTQSSTRCTPTSPRSSPSSRSSSGIKVVVTVIPVRQLTSDESVFISFHVETR